MNIQSDAGKHWHWAPIRSAVLIAFGIVATVVPGQMAVAQGTGAADGVLEEIVVTSRRYEERLQDAPVAVNVITAEFINNNRIERADDIMNYTPGATWESFSKVQPVASMRGIIAPTPGNSSSEASIQTVVDNVVITKDFMKSPPLFDLNRIEVCAAHRARPSGEMHPSASFTLSPIDPLRNPRLRSLRHSAVTTASRSTAI